MNVWERWAMIVGTIAIAIAMVLAFFFGIPLVGLALVLVVALLVIGLLRDAWGWGLIAVGVLFIFGCCALTTTALWFPAQLASLRFPVIQVPAQAAPQNPPPTDAPVVPTVPPVVPTQIPAGPAGYNVPEPAGTSSLKYDETGCPVGNPYQCLDGTGQTEFPAVYVRNIQSGDKVLFQGIAAIQQLAQAAGVPSMDRWTELDAHPVSPTFVWCPSGCSWIPDTAFPLLGIGSTDDDFAIGIVQAHYPADPQAGVTKIVCPAGDCWAVPLR